MTKIIAKVEERKEINVGVGDAIFTEGMWCIITKTVGDCYNRKEGYTLVEITTGTAICFIKESLHQLLIYIDARVNIEQGVNWFPSDDMIVELRLK